MRRILWLDDDTEISENILTVRWSPDGRYLATGDDGLGGGTPDLAVYQFDAAFQNSTEFTFSNVKIFLNCNVTFRELRLTFSGDSTINGRGNTLSLDSTFTLLLGEESSLLFKNLTVEGINDSNISALDELGTFSLHNVEFVLDGDYTFTQGHFEVLNDFKLSGKGQNFIYQSDQASIIRGGLFEAGSGGDACDSIFDGCLILDHGVTFSYDPPSGESNLLVLEDTVSKIRMNSATLCATTSLQLTKGILQVDGKSFLSSTNGIIFGDCTEANNLCVEILPAANLEVTSGELIYNNV